MSLTHAGLQAARAQLHTDLDSYIDAAAALASGPEECSPVIFFHLGTGLSWMTCAQHGATVTAPELDRRRRDAFLGDMFPEASTWL